MFVRMTGQRSNSRSPTPKSGYSPRREDQLRLWHDRCRTNLDPLTATVGLQPKPTTRVTIDGVELHARDRKATAAHAPAQQATSAPAAWCAGLSPIPPTPKPWAPYSASFSPQNTADPTT